MSKPGVRFPGDCIYNIRVFMISYSSGLMYDRSEVTGHLNLQLRVTRMAKTEISTTKCSPDIATYARNCPR